MASSTLTKTIQSELKAITNVSAGAQSVSSTLDVSTVLAAEIFVDISPEATNTPGTEIPRPCAYQIGKKA